MKKIAILSAISLLFVVVLSSCGRKPNPVDIAETQKNSISDIIKNTPTTYNGEIETLSGKLPIDAEVILPENADNAYIISKKLLLEDEDVCDNYAANVLGISSEKAKEIKTIFNGPANMNSQSYEEGRLYISFDDKPTFSVTYHDNLSDFISVYDMDTPIYADVSADTKENVTTLAENFLEKCFSVDFNLRITNILTYKKIDDNSNLPEFSYRISFENTYKGTGIYSKGFYMLGDSNIIIANELIEIICTENTLYILNSYGISQDKSEIKTIKELTSFENALEIIRVSSKIADPRFFNASTKKYSEITKIEFAYVAFPPENVENKITELKYDLTTIQLYFNEIELRPAWVFSSDITKNNTSYLFVIDATTGEPYLCSQ